MAVHIAYYGNKAHDQATEKRESATRSQGADRVGHKRLPVVEYIKNFSAQNAADGCGDSHFIDAVVGPYLHFFCNRRRFLIALRFPPGETAQQSGPDQRCGPVHFGR